jgi:outer membrane protein OmpA-like peptidoglycan-associated protein/outer membrane protein assembly factor BamD (BamD/ComL family)
MKTLFQFIFLLALVLTSCSTVAQSKYSTKNKKAIQLYEDAMRVEVTHYDKRSGRVDYKAAINMLEQALKRDNNFIEAHELIAELYMGYKEYDKTIFHLNRSIELRAGNSTSAFAYFLLAKAYYQNGQYENALKSMEKYLNIGSSREKFTPEVKLFMESCEFAIYAKKNPVNFNPINLGPTVNTKHHEYFPTLTVDGKTLLFTRRLPAPGTEHGEQEDFFVTHLVNGKWTEAEPMPSNINTPNNEGAPTFAPDGRTLVFVACVDAYGSYGANRSGKGSCDLFITKKVGTQWRNPVNLPGGVNTPNWETQPSLSSDGKTMYFIRGIQRRDGTKDQDIYRAFLQSDGSWSKAERLPDIINTPFREESVFIHPDGRTLYFSSEGHPGFGGLDIFMSTMDDNGNWSRPVNLGYPINTEYDENSLLVAANGELAFFASDRAGGFGGLDLYAFEMPEHIRPTKTLYMEGLVFDARTQRPIGGRFELIDLSNGKTIITADADKLTGEFLVSLPTKRDYAIFVSYPNYSDYSLNFSLKNQDDNEPFKLNIPLEPVIENANVRLENVFFDLGKSTLRPESQIELNRLVDHLKQNSTMTIEIGGHTDSRGNAQENLVLSQSRAKAVMDYLISQGIAASRLTAKGYASSQPVFTDEQIAAMASNQERERAHQLNRRTEYKIITK